MQEELRSLEVEGVLRALMGLVLTVRRVLAVMEETVLEVREVLLENLIRVHA